MFYDMVQMALLPLQRKACQIFICLKNPSPQLGLNLRTLGPMANVLTITLPRRTTMSHTALLEMLFQILGLIEVNHCHTTHRRLLHFIKSFGEEV
jgi:hypothetical protein